MSSPPAETDSSPDGVNGGWTEHFPCDATLANYCSDECLRHDPGWYDTSIWMA
jgi:hypothetical protein